MKKELRKADRISQVLFNLVEEVDSKQKDWVLINAEIWAKKTSEGWLVDGMKVWENGLQLNIKKWYQFWKNF